jgi:hypothetical protein
MTGIRPDTATYYGMPCKYGHASGLRYVTTRDCVDCVYERNQRRHAKNRDEDNERYNRWYKENRAAARKQQNAYSAANREKKNADSRAWWARRGSALRRERRIQAKALAASGVNTGENL